MDETNKTETYEAVAITEERRPPALPTSYESGEEEGTIDLLAYLRVIRKRRWTILTIFVTLVAVVFVWTLMQKPIYRATALLEIERESPPIPTVRELFEFENVSTAYLETQYKVLQSTSLARRVIDQRQLAELEEFNPSESWWSLRSKQTTSAPQSSAAGGISSKFAPHHNQRVLERFQERVSVRPVRRSRLVQVSFESQDPELAAHVVNTLVSNHIEQSLNTAQEASRWLSQQLSDLKARLEKSERELQQYAYKHGLLFLQTEARDSANIVSRSENIINQRLRQLQEKLTEAHAERFQKESLYRIIEKGDYTSIPALFEDRVTEDLAVRLAELNRQQAQLARTATPGDSKTNEIQGQIESIEKVLTREREHAARRIRNDYLAAVRREELVRQAFKEEKKRANLIAGKMVQYNVLKREVETNRELYEGLLQNLKESMVSTGWKSTNIRIVDAAEPPDGPVRPRLALNLALAVILGLGLGLGTAFVQEFLENSERA